MSHTIHGTFISEKINKIRWRPDFMNDSHFFVTGSWDNDEENHVKLWDFQENEEDDEIYPFLISDYSCRGDVTEIKFLNGDYLVASSSLGSVYLLKITSDEGLEPTIDSKIAWKTIHEFPNGDPSPCTAFSVYDTDIVTVGEDGRINLLNSQHQTVIKTFENADNCSINCVTFLKHNEILTSNLLGQMKIWDLRSPKDSPHVQFMFGGELVAPTCLEYHPTQRHLIVAGDEDGSLTVWDLRQHTYPINLLSAHENSVSEIRFHPDHPDQLFSCSTAGDIWHWSPKAYNLPTVGVSNYEQNVWLADETIKNRLEIFTLMPILHKPINSLDVNQNKVICGCDNEALYLINGIQVF